MSTNAQSQPGKLKITGVVYDADGNPKGNVVMEAEMTPEEAARLGLAVEPQPQEEKPDGDHAHQQRPPQRPEPSG